MSQRNSEYARKERDDYSTPEWVTQAVIPHLRRPLRMIWEPAAGEGKMAAVLGRLDRARQCVWETDITRGDDYDFLSMGFRAGRYGPRHVGFDLDAIVTNPPYGLAQEFVEHALELMKPTGGQVAMLLRVDWDSAGTRAHLFRDCPAWCRKVVLTKRIVWFVEADGKPKASPSENHAWFCWNWQHEGPPTIGYAP